MRSIIVVSTVQFSFDPGHPSRCGGIKRGQSYRSWDCDRRPPISATKSRRLRRWWKRRGIDGTLESNAKADQKMKSFFKVYIYTASRFFSSQYRNQYLRFFYQNSLRTFLTPEHSTKSSPKLAFAQKKREGLFEDGSRRKPGKTSSIFAAGVFLFTGPGFACGRGLLKVGCRFKKPLIAVYIYPRK